MPATRKDSDGRTWTYNDAEGTYALGPFLIGCGGNNGRRWMDWNSKDKYPVEHETLKAAMAACYIPQDKGQRTQDA